MDKEGADKRERAKKQTRQPNYLQGYQPKFCVNLYTLCFKFSIGSLDVSQSCTNILMCLVIYLFCCFSNLLCLLC